MKNKGFTLVELIVTLILLAIVGSIIVFNINSNNKTQKENEYAKYVEKINSAALVYTELNRTIVDGLEEDKKNVVIKVEDLISSGLLNDDIINPYTNKEISPDDYIVTSLDEKSGLIKYEFEDESQEYFGLTEDEIQQIKVEKQEELKDIKLSVSDINIPINKLINSINGVNNASELNNYYKQLKDYGDYRLKLYSNDTFIQQFDTYNLKVDKITPHDIDGVGEYIIYYSWTNNVGVRKVEQRKVNLTTPTCNLTINAQNVYVGSTYYSQYVKNVEVTEDQKETISVPSFNLKGYNFEGLIYNSNLGSVYIAKSDLNKEFTFKCNGDVAVLQCDNDLCKSIPTNQCVDGKLCKKDNEIVSQKKINLTINLANPLRINNSTVYKTSIYYNQTSGNIPIVNTDSGHYYFNTYSCNSSEVELIGWVGYNTNNPGTSQNVKLRYKTSSPSEAAITCNVSSAERYVAMTTCTTYVTQTVYRCHQESVNAYWSNYHCHNHTGAACDSCYTCSYCGACSVYVFTDHSAHLTGHNRTVCNYENETVPSTYSCCPSGTTPNGRGSCKYV